MEHIVQFGISIDDNTIVKRIEANAEKTITQNIQREIAKHIFDMNYAGDRVYGLNERTEQMFKDWLEDHKDEIIERATEKVAANMMRTKAVRAAIDDLSKGC